MEKFLKTTIVNWDKGLALEDKMISFLLYQEGKSIALISKIRNLPMDIIQEHIIQAKISEGKADKGKYAPVLVKLLSSTKEERIRFLDECSKDETVKLVSYLKAAIPQIQQPEDKMVALWIAGHISANELLAEIRREYLNKHGGVRRMVCSALRKMPHQDNLPTLHKALQDNKPQVRQYAAKALGQIGDKKTLYRLKNLLNKPDEMDYVKRAYRQAIEEIEARTKEGS